MSETFQIITRFFHGESLASILKGQGNRESDRTITDIYNYNDKQLEEDHSFIQWIFPTPRLSAFNRNAPILTKQDITMLKSDPTVMEWLNLFKYKMFTYWGIENKDFSQCKILKGHNGLRLSRAIECLTFFGIDIVTDLLVIDEFITLGILKPEMELYQGQMTPVWFIRYKQAIANRS